ncbi:MAG: TRAP transporter small permease [Gammaproteobacteria bacterium]
MLVALALMITVDIALRELRTFGLLSFNWQFVSEWSAFLVIFVVFAGLAYTLRSNGHITVAVIVDRLPPGMRQVLVLLAASISAVVLGYMFYRSIVWMMLSIERGITSTSVVRTPMWIPNAFVVAGLGLFAIAMLLTIARLSVDLWSGRSTRPTAGEPGTATDAAGMVD